MKSNTKVSIAAGSVSAALLLMILCASPRRHEPSFNGRSLHAWLEDLDENNNPKEVQDQARLAVQHIGTNALPFLIRCISYREPAWQRKADKLLALTRFRTIFKHRARQYEQYASDGFKALQSIASPAVPELGILSLDPATTYGASWAMGFIGVEALPIILSNLTNTEPRIRCAAIYGISNMGTNAAAASQSLLISLTRDSDIDVRKDAYMALGEVARSPDIVPLLVRGLQDSNFRVRMLAAFAIGRFGNGASVALPALEQALNDPDENVARNASVSIQMLRPTPSKDLTN